MGWLASICIAVLNGALCLLLAGLIANACADWYQISGFEGKAGYFVVLTALLGGVAGLILGLIAARVIAAGANPSFVKGLLAAVGISVVLAGFAALVCRALADVSPTIDGNELDLEVEIKLPAGQSIDPAADPGKPGETFLRLGSVVRMKYRKSQMGKLNLAQARNEDGRWIVPGSVYLFTTRGKRSIDASIAGKHVAAFFVPLPRNPDSRYEQWSDWGPTPRANQPPLPDSKPSFRFRVVQRLPEPEPPDPEEVETQRWNALKPEAPLTEWLSFFEYEAPPERKQAILKVATERPAELATLICSPDESERERALTVVAELPTIDPQISEAVLAEQRNIVAALRRFNEMDEKDPRFVDVQLELRGRFSHWHRAWWRVHQKTGVNGRPPVEEILKLAEVRARGTSMDEIVLNANAHLRGLDELSP